MPMTLQGKSALITGSTDGLGFAIARGLAAEGCNVVINGLADPGHAEERRRELETTFGVRALYDAAHLRKPDAITAMARTADDEEQLEEERRLLYVAMTRPRNQLYVTYPLHSYPSRTGADFAYGQLSRFLDPGVRQTMQRVTLAPDAPPDLPAPREDSTMDLRALLRGRFGGA